MYIRSEDAVQDTIMTTHTLSRKQILPPGVLFTCLPGPTRKRLLAPYCYRLIHQQRHSHAPGCLLLWDVLGGRDIYQVALERLDGGKLRWHCTCADAIYRGEKRGSLCKHVQGLRSYQRYAE